MAEASSVRVPAGEVAPRRAGDASSRGEARQGPGGWRGSPASRRRATTGAALGALVLLIGGARWWWTQLPDASVVLGRTYAPLARVERQPAAHLGPRIERWSFSNARGESLVGLYRAAPAGTSGRTWTVVLLGGLQTGPRATLALPESLPANVLAVDWPWQGPRQMRALEFLRALPAIRRALLRTPAALALGLEAAAAQPDIDSTRIALLGASLGVPPALAALRLSCIPRALVLVHGGADLPSMLEHALRRERYAPILAAAAAALAGRLVYPLEPALHAPLVGSMPVLVMNATDDERVPRRSIAALHAALPTADVRWQSGAHMRPRDRAGLADVAADVAAWLAALPAEAVRGAPPGLPEPVGGGAVER